MKRILAGLALTAGMFTATSAMAETITLKLSHFLPSSHPIQTDFLEPWARSVEEKSGGKVKFEIYPAGSAFGHVAKQMDQVRAGVVDVAHGLTGIPRGRLPRTLIMDMPFLVKTSDAASRTLWDLYTGGQIADEYKGMKVLALHAHNAGLIHSRGKQIKTMDDMKGMRLRTPSQAIAMMIKALGGTPVGLPPTQVYENLQKGVIDGNVFPYEPVHSFKLSEVLDYHLDAKAYTTSFFFVMNQRKYDSLPDDVKKAIDEASGETLIAKFGPWWNSWDEMGIADIKKKGNPVSVLSDEERGRWREALAPVIEAYLGEIEKQGVANAREIYAKAQELVAKYE